MSTDSLTTRIEFTTDLKDKRRLEQLRTEFKEVHQITVSMDLLVSTIVKMYLERIPEHESFSSDLLSSLEGVDKTHRSSRKS